MAVIKVDENDPVGELEPSFPFRDVKVLHNVDVRVYYDLKEEIGRGKFGTVYRCVEKKTGTVLAAKFVAIAKKQDRINVEREVEIMRTLQHPRLIQLYDSFEIHNVMCVVLELIEGGELFERVIDDDFILTEKACSVFMRQICEGVGFIHTNQVIHLDLKPENILCLTKTGNRIKIIDFGLARKYDPNKKLQVLFGTPEFVAPEVVNFDEITSATDMWSVGVICYVLLSGLSPFMGENDLQTMTNVTMAQYDFEDEAFDTISPDAKDFISNLLVKNKEMRMTADDCIGHAWLKRKTQPPSMLLEESKENLKTFVDSNHSSSPFPLSNSLSNGSVNGILSSQAAENHLSKREPRDDSAELYELAPELPAATAHQDKGILNQQNLKLKNEINLEKSVRQNIVIEADSLSGEIKGSQSHPEISFGSNTTRFDNKELFPRKSKLIKTDSFKELPRKFSISILDGSRELPRRSSLTRADKTKNEIKRENFVTFIGPREIKPIDPLSPELRIAVEELTNCIKFNIKEPMNLKSEPNCKNVESSLSVKPMKAKNNAKEVDVKTQKEARKEPKVETRKESKKETRKEPREEITTNISEETRKEPKQETQKGPKEVRETKDETKKKPREESKKEFEKGTKKELRDGAKKGFKEEIMKEPKGENGKDSKEETGKHVKGETKKEHKDNKRNEPNEVTRKEYIEDTREDSKEVTRKEPEENTKKESRDETRKEPKEKTRRESKEETRKEPKDVTKIEYKDKSKNETKEETKKEPNEVTRIESKDKSRKESKEGTRRNSKDESSKELRELIRSEPRGVIRKEPTEELRKEAKEGTRKDPKDESNKELKELIRLEPGVGTRKESREETKKESKEEKTKVVEEKTRRDHIEEVKTESREETRKESKEEASNKCKDEIRKECREETIKESSNQILLKWEIEKEQSQGKSNEAIGKRDFLTVGEKTESTGSTKVSTNSTVSSTQKSQDRVKKKDDIPMFLRPADYIKSVSILSSDLSNTTYKSLENKALEYINNGKSVRSKVDNISNTLSTLANKIPISKNISISTSVDTKEKVNSLVCKQSVVETACKRQAGKVQFLKANSADCDISDPKLKSTENEVAKSWHSALKRNDLTLSRKVIRNFSTVNNTDDSETSTNKTRASSLDPTSAGYSTVENHDNIFHSRYFRNSQDVTRCVSETPVSKYEEFRNRYSDYKELASDNDKLFKKSFVQTGVGKSEKKYESPDTGARRDAVEDVPRGSTSTKDLFLSHSISSSTNFLTRQKFKLTDQQRDRYNKFDSLNRLSKQSTVNNWKAEKDRHNSSGSAIKETLSHSHTSTSPQIKSKLSVPDQNPTSPQKSV